MKHSLLLFLMFISTSIFAQVGQNTISSDQKGLKASMDVYDIGIQGDTSLVDTILNYLPRTAFYLVSSLNLQETDNDKVATIKIPAGINVENLPDTGVDLIEVNKSGDVDNGYTVEIKFAADAVGIFSFQLGLNAHPYKVYSGQKLDIKTEFLYDNQTFKKDLNITVVDENGSGNVRLDFSVRVTSSRPKVDVPTEFYTEIFNIDGTFASYLIKNYKLDLKELRVDTAGSGTYYSLSSLGLDDDIIVETDPTKGVTYDNTTKVLTFKDQTVSFMTNTPNLPFTITFPSVSGFNDNTVIKFDLSEMVSAESYENGFTQSPIPSNGFDGYRDGTYRFAKGGKSVNIYPTAAANSKGVKGDVPEMDLFKIFAQDVSFDMKELKFEVNIPAGIKITSVHAPALNTALKTNFIGNIKISKGSTELLSIEANETGVLSTPITGPGPFTVTIDEIPLGVGISNEGGSSYFAQGIMFIGEASSTLTDFEVSVDSDNIHALTDYDNDNIYLNEELINAAYNDKVTVSIVDKQITGLDTRYSHFLTTEEANNNSDKNSSFGIADDVIIRNTVRTATGYYYGTAWRTLEKPVLFISYPDELIPASGTISKNDFDIYTSSENLNSYITDVSYAPDSLSTYSGGHVVRVDLADYTLTTDKVTVDLKLMVREDLTSGSIYPSYAKSFLVSTTDDGISSLRAVYRSSAYTNTDGIKGYKDYATTNGLTSSNMVGVKTDLSDPLVISAPIELTFKNLGSPSTDNGGTFTRVSKNEIDTEYPKYYIGEEGMYRFQIYNTLTQDSTIDAKGYFVFPDLSILDVDVDAASATIDKNKAIDIDIDYMLDPVSVTDTAQWDWINDDYNNLQFAGVANTPSSNVYGLKWELIELPRDTQWKLNIPFKSEYRKTFDASIYGAHRGISSYGAHEFINENIPSAGFFIKQSNSPTVTVTGIANGDNYDFINRDQLINDFKSYTVEDDRTDELVVYDTKNDVLKDGNIDNLSDTSKVVYYDNTGTQKTVTFAEFANLTDADLGSGLYTFTYTTEQDADAQISSTVITVTVKNKLVYSITYKDATTNTEISDLSGLLQPTSYTTDDWDNNLPDSATVAKVLSEYTGYEFLGWSEDISSSTYTDVIPSKEENLTFYAHFSSTPTDYNIKYLMLTTHEDISSSVSSNFTSYNVTELAFTLPTASDIASNTNPGYTFVNWTSDGSNTVTSIPVNSIGNKTYYAVWTGEQKNITYYDDDRTTVILGLSPTQFTVGAGTEINKEPTKPGYTFVEWQDENGKTVTSISKDETEDVKLYAVWKDKYYSITYIDNISGDILTYEPSWDYFYTAKDTITFPTNVDIYGNSFIGWSSDKDTYANVSGISKGGSSNVTVYAFFDESKIVNPINIYYYNLYSETGTPIEESITTDELPYSLSYTLTNDKSEFIGWSLSESLAASNITINSISLDLLNDETVPYTINLYASWKDIPDALAYPTIVTDKVTIDVLEAGNYVYIYSINGSLVMKEKMTSTNEEIYIGSLPAGMYIVKEEKTGRTAKIVVTD